MKKFPLHWQILVALIIAVLYGMYFSTNYQLTDNSFKKLKTSGIPADIVSELSVLKGENFEDNIKFFNAIEKAIGKEKADKYKGTFLKHAYLNEPVKHISWLGDIFLRALKMLIIPLILCSIISGVANMGGSGNLGRMGLKTMIYYISTSTFAILTGLFFVNIFKPGIGADLNFSQKVEGLILEHKTLGQTLVEIVPDNIFTALSQNQMLSVIFFSLLFGFFITRITTKYKNVLIDFFNAGFEVMMKFTMFVIRFTPLGIFGIVAKVVADQSDLVDLGARMGLYMGTVLIALAVHAIITLPLLVRLVGKSNPIKHFRSVTTPLLTAFSTSSSGATLPLTMNAIEKNVGVSNKVSSFTLPLGATVNMDGTALYECVAAMFIAQAYGIEMTIVQQIIIVITALLASIGAAAVPMAGLVMITLILTAVGLPLEGVGLILAVDRILDMFRTSINVWSDTCCAVVIAKSEGEKLKIDNY